MRPASKGVPDLIPPRHWAWFALCADDTKTTNTVVSIHEAPNYETPPKGVPTAEWEASELRNMRANTIAVLAQLSKLGIAVYQRDLFSLKAIRESEKLDSSSRSATMVPAHEITETAASYLFYYLFEDYSAVSPVLNNSRHMLKDITRRVLGGTKKGDRSDTADVIPELHKLGRDLRQLRHLFESYKNLFKNIVQPPDIEDKRDVKLAAQARDRFRRLRDRLQLLMLNTMEEYINEKTELSNTVSLSVGTMPYYSPLADDHTFRLVLQPHRPKRLGSNSPADPQRHAAGQAERLLPAHQLHDELLLRPGQGAEQLHGQGLLELLRRRRDGLVYKPLLLQQDADVCQRQVGRDRGELQRESQDGIRKGERPGQTGVTKNFVREYELGNRIQASGRIPGCLQCREWPTRRHFKDRL